MDEPMEVMRVEERDGADVLVRTHIEPPLDQDWSQHHKLRWHAGVMLADTGIKLNIREFKDANRRFSTFSIYNDTGWGVGAQDFRDCWLYINGLHRGAQLMADLLRTSNS